MPCTAAYPLCCAGGLCSCAGRTEGLLPRCFGAQEAERFHARTTADDKRGSKRVIRLLPAACCLLRIQTLRSGESGCRCGSARLILPRRIRAPPSACSAQHRLCACASVLSAFRLCGNRSFRMPNGFLLSAAPSPETAESRGCVLLSAVRRFLSGGNGAGCCKAVFRFCFGGAESSCSYPLLAYKESDFRIVEIQRRYSPMPVPCIVTSSYSKLCTTR